MIEDVATPPSGIPVQVGGGVNVIRMLGRLFPYVVVFNKVALDPTALFAHPIALPGVDVKKKLFTPLAVPCLKKSVNTSSDPPV